MGLDITAYSNLKPVGQHVAEDEWCDLYDEHVSAFAYVGFEQSFRGVPILGEQRGFIVGGCYAITDTTETHGFRAGSYGGYNQWRADLQQQFNPARNSDAPFYELIWFADNEGSIGPDAATDLLADFRAHADRYVDSFDGYGRQKFEDWTRAFELAANGGLVQFH